MIKGVKLRNSSHPIKTTKNMELRRQSVHLQSNMLEAISHARTLTTTSPATALNSPGTNSRIRRNSRVTLTPISRRSSSTTLSSFMKPISVDSKGNFSKPSMISENHITGNHGVISRRYSRPLERFASLSKGDAAKMENRSKWEKVKKGLTNSSAR